MTAEIRTATLEDLPAIGELARRTWRAYYPAIISSEQIEYMLSQRYTPEAMRQAVTSGELTYEQLFADGELLGFVAHGPSDRPDELKLHQLYLVPSSHGRGFGRILLKHIEDLARRRGLSCIRLTVNKRNERALNFYRRSGFNIREAAVFDIGGGFVMDDYVMTKALETIS